MVISLSAHCALCCKDFPQHTMRLLPALLQWQWPAVAVNPAFLGSCGVRGVEISGNHLVPGTCINMETPAAKTGCEDSLVQSIKPVQIQKKWALPLTELLTWIWSTSASKLKTRNPCYRLRDIYSSNENRNTLLIWNTLWFHFQRQTLLADGDRHEWSR